MAGWASGVLRWLGLGRVARPTRVAVPPISFATLDMTTTFATLNMTTTFASLDMTDPGGSGGTLAV